MQNKETKETKETIKSEDIKKNKEEAKKDK